MRPRPSPSCCTYFYPRPPRGGRHADEGVVVVAPPISIHALREEGDLQMASAAPLPGKFLSTPSARRATGFVGGAATTVANFYPRPPRGGRLEEHGLVLPLIVFLSTPSARRATQNLQGDRGDIQISIHALREEGDRLCQCLGC